MAPHNDAGDLLAMRRRRLRYRAWHRGTREMDLMLGPFADAWADRFDEGEVDRFESLLEEPDTELLKWLMGQAAPPPGVDTELLSRLVTFRTTTSHDR